MNGLGQGSGLHFGSIAVGGSEHPAIDAAGRGVALVRHLLPGFDGDLVDIIGQGLGARIREAVAAADESAFLDPDSVEFRAPFRRCRMIWGIGLNYRDHAGDLNEQVPDEPASFFGCPPPGGTSQFTDWPAVAEISVAIAASLSTPVSTTEFSASSSALPVSPSQFGTSGRIFESASCSA